MMAMSCHDQSGLDAHDAVGVGGREGRATAGFVSRCGARSGDDAWLELSLPPANCKMVGPSLSLTKLGDWVTG